MGRPRRGGKGMACDVGVTRGENGRSRSRTRFVATLVRGINTREPVGDSSARGRLPRGLRHARRPAHDAALEIVVRDLVLARADASAHRYPRLVHGLGVARNEWVPPVEVASLGQKAIGAAWRQPHDSVYISGG